MRYNIKITFRKAVGVLCIAGLLGGLASCSSFFDEESHHVLPDGNRWSTLEDARSGLMGMYGLMRAALADNNTQWACGDLRYGDFTANNRKDLNAIIHNDLDMNIGMIDEIADWRRFYAVVNAAAVFMDNVGKVEQQDQAYSEDAMKWDIAQARTLRALAYFYMVRIWGDVPLITQAYDNGTFPNVARTPAKEVLAYAKNELIAAAKDLPYAFGSDNNQYYRQKPSFWQGNLFNKLSAYAILAHVCAWEGNYADAETYSGFVYDNYAKLSISQPIMAVSDIVSSTGLFNGTSGNDSRRLVSLNMSISGEYGATQTGHLEEWTLCSPYIPRAQADLYVSRDSLLKIYPDANDERCGVDTTTMKYYTNYVNMSADIPVFIKVNVVQNGSADNGNFAIYGSSILLSRMEDMLLLHAESAAALNRTEEAILDVNELRSQRGVTKVSYNRDFGGEQTRLIDFIFAERRRELIGEGHRWYDQIRRQRLLKDNSSFLKLIEEGGIYWPVSEKVLQNNSAITQNTYWTK